jgi:hypothetical protein
MTEQDLLEMPLHSIKEIKKSSIWVMRVLGGWLYSTRTTISRNDDIGCITEPIQVSTTTTFVPEPRPLTVDYSGYEEWLKSQEEQYPEPEINKEQAADESFLTLGHY